MEHVEQVVLLIHGIRTQADWQPMLVSLLEEKGKIRVHPIKYGYFDVFRFWLPLFTRQAPIKRVEKEFRSARKKYPHAKISVIAHSFGSYIIGKLLKEQFDLELDRLILCGSVLPDSYPWEDVMHKFIGGNNEQVLNVINECGKKDIWPVLARMTSWGYGDSGTHGFGQVLVKDRFHNVKHSEYFTRDFATTYWKPFVENGEYRPTEFEVNMPNTSWLLSVLKLFPFKIAVFAGLLFVGLVMLLPRELVCETYNIPSVCTINEESCDKPWNPDGLYRGQNQWGVLLIKDSSSQKFSGTDNGENQYFSHSTRGIFIGHQSFRLPLNKRTIGEEDYTKPGKGACSSSLGNIVKNTFKIETTRVNLKNDGCTTTLYGTIIFTGDDHAEVISNGSDGLCDVPMYPTEEERRRTIKLFKSHKHK
jgi:hypothetical protein